MKIRARLHQDLHGIMRGRGLPARLLRADGEISLRDLSTCTHASCRAVSPRDQAQGLQRCMTRPWGSWTLVVGTRHDPDLTGLLGLEFFARCTLQHLAEPHRTRRPLWHQVLGGWNDRLRDDSEPGRNYRAHLGPLGAMVLDGVTVDGPTEKIEKVRDLLLWHDGPRMVLVSGGDPLAFCLDRLQRRPEHVAYVNRSVLRANRDQSGDHIS